jgi:hypothetical protein
MDGCTWGRLHSAMSRFPREGQLNKNLEVLPQICCGLYPSKDSGDHEHPPPRKHHTNPIPKNVPIFSTASENLCMQTNEPSIPSLEDLVSHSSPHVRQHLFALVPDQSLSGNPSKVGHSRTTPHVSSTSPSPHHSLSPLFSIHPRCTAASMGHSSTSRRLFSIPSSSYSPHHSGSSWVTEIGQDGCLPRSGR